MVGMLEMPERQSYIHGLSVNTPLRAKLGRCRGKVGKV